MNQIKSFITPEPIQTSLAKYWNGMPVSRHHRDPIFKPVKSELCFFVAHRIHFKMKIILGTPSGVQKEYLSEGVDCFYADEEKLKIFPKPSSTYFRKWALNTDSDLASTIGSIVKECRSKGELESASKLFNSEQPISELPNAFYIGEIRKDYSPMSQDYYLTRKYYDINIARANIPPGLLETSTISPELLEFHSDYVLVPVHLYFDEERNPEFIAAYPSDQAKGSGGGSYKGDWDEINTFGKLKRAIFNIEDI